MGTHGCHVAVAMVLGVLEKKLINEGPFDKVQKKIISCGVAPPVSKSLLGPNILYFYAIKIRPLSPR